MSRRDIIGGLAGGAILAFSIWGLLFGPPSPATKAFLLLDGLIGLYIVAKATERLLAVRFPPPPKKPVTLAVFLTRCQESSVRSIFTST